MAGRNGKTWYNVIAVPHTAGNVTAKDWVAFGICVDLNDEYDMNIVDEVARNKLGRKYGSKYQDAPIYTEFTTEEMDEL